ncbi:MAG: guanylate kinase [Caldiserica bacterium]|nr:MAG: guanylate kinase [Caldisericota bacterium]
MTVKEKNLIIVLSAPSGAGKTTLCKALLKKFPEILYSVSCTSRPPRKGEKNGRDYFFVSKEEFEKMIKNNEFIEWAKVHGYYYGTPLKNIETAKKLKRDIVLDIDVQGGRKIKKKFKDAVMIFISPPSIKVLKERLIKRGKDSLKEIEKRIRIAKLEMKEKIFYDYEIINDDLKEAKKKLFSIYIAEKCKIRRKDA